MTLLTLAHVTKRYGQATAVDDASFAVDRCTVRGFLVPHA